MKITPLKHCSSLGEICNPNALPQNLGKKWWSEVEGEKGEIEMVYPALGVSVGRMGNHPALQRRRQEPTDQPCFGKSPASHSQAGEEQDPRLSFTSPLLARMP